jgi:hypothetical protein
VSDAAPRSVITPTATLSTTEASASACASSIAAGTHSAPGPIAAAGSSLCPLPFTKARKIPSRIGPEPPCTHATHAPRRRLVGYFLSS